MCTQLWCQDFSSPEHCWLFEGAVLSIRYLVLCILGMLLSLGCMKREKAVVCWIVLLTGLQRQWKCLLQREASSSFSFSLGTMMQVLGEWIAWLCIGAVITRSEVVLFNVEGYSYSLSIVAWLSVVDVALFCGSTEKLGRSWRMNEAMADTFGAKCVAIV